MMRLLVILFLDGLLSEVAVLVLVLRDPPALLHVLVGPDEACKPAGCTKQRWGRSSMKGQGREGGGGGKGRRGEGRRGEGREGQGREKGRGGEGRGGEGREKGRGGGGAAGARTSRRE